MKVIVIVKWRLIHGFAPVVALVGLCSPRWLGTAIAGWTWQ